MIRVLIADDEPIMRNVYQNLFDWESHGFSIVGTVRDGQEALETVQSEDVDIVITDLKMPVMDGLEFISMAKQEKPNLKFVVVSGFDEFQSVREAYRLGVCDYLIKTEITSENVLESVCKLKTEIETERILNRSKTERDEKYEEMERTLFLNRLVLREKLLKELFFGESDKNINEKLWAQGITLGEKGITVMSVQLEDYYKIEKDLYNGDRELFKYAIANVLEELSGELEHFCQFCNLPHEYIVAFSMDNIYEYQEHQRKCMSFFLALQRGLEGCFGCKISGGESTVGNGYKSCKKLYQQASEARRYSFIKGKGHLISHAELSFISAAREIDSDRRIQLLKEALKSVDGEHVLEITEKLVIDVKGMSLSDIGEVQELFCRYYYEIYDCSKQNEFYSQIEDLLSNYNENLREFGDLNELNTWLCDVLTLVSGIMQNDGMLTKAKSFILSNYGRNISLTDVADSLYISSRHFSRIFTKAMGMSFTEYLIKVRMDAAIALMRDKELKVYEIADRVGYANVEQFSRMFKRVVGKSPREYLKQISRKEMN